MHGWENNILRVRRTELCYQRRSSLGIHSRISTLELDGRELTPDLSVYPKTDVDLVHEEVRVTDPPLLAVEIASPTQNVQDLVQKIEFLLDVGVQSCWLVQPPLRTVTVFPGHMDGTTVSDGTLADPVLEIEIDVRDVFDPDA